MNQYDYYDKFLTQGREQDMKKIGNNTWAERNDDYIAIRYHATVIAKLYPNGDVELFTGGYHTSTTKERLNGFGSFVIFQKDFNWYARPWNTNMEDVVDFYEGIKFNVDGELIES